MKSKKLLSVLCLLTLVGCDPTTTSSSSNSSSLAGNSSSSTSSVVSSSSSTSTSTSNPTPTVEYASLVVFQDYGSYLSLSSVSVGDEFEVGSTQKFEFISQDGISIDGIDDYHVIVNGVDYPLSYGSADVNSFQEITKGYVEIEITDDLYIYTHKTFSNPNNEGFSVNLDSFSTDSYTVLGFNTEDKYTEIGFAVAAKPGYNVSEVYYTTANSAEKNILMAGHMGIYYVTLESDITLHIDSAEANFYNISYEGIENLDLEKSILPSTSTELHNVTYNFVAKEGYYIESYEVNEEAANAGTLLSGESGTFTMPSLDVTITFSIKENATITVAPNSKIASYTFYAEMDYNTYSPTKETTGYNPNNNYSFYIVAEALEGFAISEILVLNNETGEELETKKSSSYFTVLEAPACGVTVFFKVAEAQKVTLAEATNGTIEFDNGSNEGYYLLGDEVTFKVTPNEGYKVKSVTTSNESIRVYTGSEGSYYFYMGEEELTITVEFEEITYATVTLAELSGSLTSVTVEGYTSGASLEEGSSSDFHLGEEINISFNASDRKYHYSLKVTQGETTTEFELENNGTYGRYDSSISGELLITDTNVTIEIVAEERTAVTATITLPTTEGFDITWYVNDERVTEIGDLYKNDAISFLINSTPTENHNYVVTYNGETTTNNYFKISGDFSLTIEEVAVAASAPYEFINESSLTTASLKYSMNYTDWSDMEEGKLEVGKAIKFQLSATAPTTIIIEIYVGDELVATLDRGAGTRNFTLTLEDTTKVTVRAKDKA